MLRRAFRDASFDIPATVAGGAAFKLTKKVAVPFDVEWIFYGQVKSIANLDSNQAELGANNGPGFGWHDITVKKAGLDYKVSPSLTLRGGYNHSGLPFNNSQTFFNLLAPAVVQKPPGGGCNLRSAKRKRNQSCLPARVQHWMASIRLLQHLAVAKPTLGCIRTPSA